MATFKEIQENPEKFVARILAISNAKEDDFSFCTLNERKFLDELREKGEWTSWHGAIWLDNGSAISQSDFSANLQELVDGT